MMAIKDKGEYAVHNVRCTADYTVGYTCKLSIRELNLRVNRSKKRTKQSGVEVRSEERERTNERDDLN